MHSRYILPILLVAAGFICHNFVQSTSTEIAAGNAISKLLQEKISLKFKEAANEVKGVLVKHLGDSLKTAHNKMNPKKKRKIKKALKSIGGMKGAAAHQNQAGRQRKNSGPPGAMAPPKPNAQQTAGPYGMNLPGGPQQGQPGAQAQQANVMQRPGAPQCGGQCPASCAPTCDNNCCQMAQQLPQNGCPPSCMMSCFSYCPDQCCQHKKKNAIPDSKKKTNAEKTEENEDDD